MGKHSKHAKTGKWTPERLHAWKEARWGKKEAKTIKSDENSNIVADLKATETPNA